MNTYQLSLYFLFVAALSQALIGGLALKSALQRDLPSERWRLWVALSIGTLLLALHHSYTLNLALQTGLYDFRQATLVMLAGLATSFAVWQFRRLKP
ncbi:hypothetical protein [Ferribacterium limneticum]|uniref:hypothetical protein n=1 Tax=Ferribacterium limneticum TaxID=76259 RepID=UPI001CF8AF19|nr:hypothetical protein [Ferribacterium limneticum]UCV22894.1 hypothetical protein KI613_20690 [Ferribacterium limneticum]